MNNYSKFDDYDDESDAKYKNRKKKMKTLRDDDRYGSIFSKSNKNKLKNIDPDMFEYDDNED